MMETITISTSAYHFTNAMCMLLGMGFGWCLCFLLYDMVIIKNLKKDMSLAYRLRKEIER